MSSADRAKTRAWLDEARRQLDQAREQAIHVKFHGGTARFVRHDRVWTFDIRSEGDSFVAQCQEYPDLIVEARILAELDASLYSAVDTWIEAQS